MRIPLTKGHSAIVDLEDYLWLSQWKWCFDGAYAASRINGQKVRLHLLLLNVPKGSQVDHRNLNKLDYRKDNLRICLKIDNDRNKGPQINSTSRLKGVYWNKNANKWQAQIKVNGVKKHLGYFVDKLEAGEAYIEAAYKYHGNFARMELDNA